MQSLWFYKSLRQLTTSRSLPWCVQLIPEDVLVKMDVHTTCFTDSSLLQTLRQPSGNCSCSRIDGDAPDKEKAAFSNIKSNEDSRSVNLIIRDIISQLFMHPDCTMEKGYYAHFKLRWVPQTTQRMGYLTFISIVCVLQSWWQCLHSASIAASCQNKWIIGN